MNRPPDSNTPAISHSRASPLPARSGIMSVPPKDASMRNHRRSWSTWLAIMPTMFWLADARAGEAPADVYTGTLGRQAIVLQLTPGDDAATAGRYFYVRHHRDIALSGAPASNGHLQLREGCDADATGPRIA